MECPLAEGAGLGGRTEQSVGGLGNGLAPPALQGQQVVGTLGSEGSWLSESDHESFSLGHTEHSGVAEVSEKKAEGQAWEAGPWQGQPPLGVQSARASGVLSWSLESRLSSSQRRPASVSKRSLGGCQLL